VLSVLLLFQVYDIMGWKTLKNPVQIFAGLGAGLVGYVLGLLERHKRMTEAENPPGLCAYTRPEADSSHTSWWFSAVQNFQAGDEASGEAHEGLRAEPVTRSGGLVDFVVCLCALCLPWLQIHPISVENARASCCIVRCRLSS
jgi:hypothetical protein